MEEPKNNIRIIFLDKADVALDEMMVKFKLEETLEEKAVKARKNKMANIAVVDHLIKDFVKGSISEMGLVDALQKNLATPQQITEQISKEIISKIVPFLNKVSEDELEKPTYDNDAVKKILAEETQTTPISVSDTRPVPDLNIKKKEVSKEPEVKKPPIDKKSASSKTTQSNILPRKVKNEPDKYREQV